jgi:hypothetical protein
MSHGDFSDYLPRGGLLATQLASECRRVEDRSATSVYIVAKKKLHKTEQV